MNDVPYRTGIPTIRLLLEKVCSLITKYRQVIYAVVPPEKHIYVDAVMKACEDFLENVPHPRA